MRSLLSLQNQVVGVKVPSLYSDQTEMYKRTVVGFLSGFVQRISEHINTIENLETCVASCVQKISVCANEFKRLKEKVIF